MQLFAHNQKAYAAVLQMLGRTGRAAVIHPTGTGKSCIGFQLAQDHPNAAILWLSPSEYIVKTQRENLRRTDPELTLENVRFFTYAKLMLLPAQELAALAPEYIVLDEFHRCGAECWGAGVERLLAAAPGARLLGLSATHVRYLDNQRDMAEELFDGNIASEMTLGEAIVRGILPAPHYVSTVFKYQRELARYEKRVSRLKNAALCQASRTYLEALRRALEKADGLEEVFARHMADRRGKYIVFCSDYRHMREMIAQAPAWFGGVDKAPRLYAAYSQDPETSRAFAQFKADESEHLKLLFCIDMLNEGIHVPGIAGVILLRPTISPIVYKQQLGRALTAGAGNTPLILDVVNNFEGLCSIGMLQEEMGTAIQRLYAAGEGGQIVADRFEIVEQVRDCRLLFEQLQNSLGTTWEQYFGAASLYAAQHGDLQVPKRYQTPGGLHLGEWVATQRMVRAGGRPGVLTPQQIARLDGIGMVWENRLESAWERKFAYAEEYHQAHGDLLAPAKYKTEDGFALGAWLCQLRQQRAGGEKANLLNEERIRRLDAIGMQWDVLSLKWEANFLQAARYYAREGDLMVPAHYKTESGFALGAWIRNLRQARKGANKARRPTEEQIRRLDAIGMYWGDCNDNAWQKGYAAAALYYARHGNLEVPAGYRAPDGTALGRWVARQRSAYLHPEKENARLTPQRVQKLEAIGMRWQKPDSWEERYALARQYLEQNGDLALPAHYKTENGIWLGRWLYEQKRIREGKSPGKTLSPLQEKKLRQLGI